MKYKNLAAALSLTLLAGAAQAESGQTMEITPASERDTIIGSADYFVGHAIVNPLFSATEHTRATAANVTFSPGARSNWHTHPAGQTLVVTSGTGWIQRWDGKKREISAGDVIWTPPGVKHWHGATASTSMSHTAIQEEVEGNNVEWMEPVSDEQYNGE